MAIKQYNTTQLYPETTFEKHVFHRDQFAHYLRWTHVLKIARIGMNILDFGCGNANLLEVFYRNRFKPKSYLGLDIRNNEIEKLRQKWSNLEYAKFEAVDLCGEFNFGNEFDIISCFEVIEHIGKENADKFLLNIKKHMNPQTILLLSTPNYDEKTGAANNHIINGKICEFEHFELQEILNRYFHIEKKYGTFASQSDYKPLLNDWQMKMFTELSGYYDSNLISNIMAPMFPEQSRNCLWVLKIKGG